MGSCCQATRKEHSSPEADRTPGGKGMMFQGHVALITGAARGLGRSFAEALLERGSKVCVADIDSEQGEATVGELQARHGPDKVTFFTCDVTKDEHFKGAWDAAEEKLGPISLLINNAGIGNEQEWHKTVEVNLGGCMRGTLLALDRMGTNKGGAGGVVVNIASIVGLKANPFGPVYSATKHAIVGLTRSLGSDFHLKVSGVKVQALCPSLVKTELLANAMKKAFSPEVAKAMGQFASGLGNMTADNVADALLKLVTEGTNGGCLVVEAEKDPYYVPAPI